jgi:hypothetical protein
MDRVARVANCHNTKGRIQVRLQSRSGNTGYHQQPERKKDPHKRETCARTSRRPCRISHSTARGTAQRRGRQRSHQSTARTFPNRRIQPDANNNLDALPPRLASNKQNNSTDKSDTANMLHIANNGNPQRTRQSGGKRTGDHS